MGQGLPSGAGRDSCLGTGSEPAGGHTGCTNVKIRCAMHGRSPRMAVCMLNSRTETDTAHLVRLWQG